LTRRGFTVVEVAIVLGVLIALTAMVVGRLLAVIDWQKKYETLRRLRAIRAGLLRHYQQNAGYVDLLPPDGDDAPVYRCVQRDGEPPVQVAGVPPESLHPGVWLLPGTPVYGTARTAAENLAKCLSGRYVSLGVGDVTFDAWHRPYVGTRGGNLFCRVVSYLSAGRNAVIDSQFDPQQGTWEVRGDDLAVSVSGCDVETEKLLETMRKLQKVAETLETYYYTRFVSDPTRNYQLDYFLEGDGALGDTCGANQVTDFPAVNGECYSWFTDDQLKALGLTREDVESAWAHTDHPGDAPDARFLVKDFVFATNANGCGPVRSPSACGRVPPYAAVVATVTPWWRVIRYTAYGKY